MPRVGVVDGVNIFIRDERTAKHKEAHFHASGPGWEASISLRTMAVIEGNLPRNKRKAVLDYARRHHGELNENYYLVQNHGTPYWIEDEA